MLEFFRLQKQYIHISFLTSFFFLQTFTYNSSYFQTIGTQWFLFSLQQLLSLEELQRKYLIPTFSQNIRTQRTQYDKVEYNTI